MAIVGTNLFQPAAIVAHEIPESPRIRVECEPQKRQVTLGVVLAPSFAQIRRGCFHQCGHNQRARVVICCVALAWVRHAEDCVLQDAGIVRHARQMMRIERRETVDSACRRIVLLRRLRLQGALESSTLEARHVLSRSLGPYCLARMEVGALAHRMPLSVVIQKVQHRFRNCAGILEWDKHASVVGQQFLRMPIRSGDDCFPCSQRDCQSSRDNLRLLPVRRNVDIRRSNMFNQFFCAHKPVHEDQAR